MLAAFGTIGGMIFGFEISSMSAWIGSDQYLEYFNHPNSAQQGGITASMSAGSFVGSLLAGWLADRLGRRTTLVRLGGAGNAWLSRVLHCRRALGPVPESRLGR